MVRYAKERKAFGKSIAEFGLIQRKIATSAARLYAAESMAYRTVGMIYASLAKLEGSQAKESKEIQRRIEEYAVECSILKVYGSEMITYVADEWVATMGGYGYVEEYPAERSYRDARINRIFEGTNEINRMIITGWLMKRAASGQLPLLKAIRSLMDEVTQPPSLNGGAGSADTLGREEEALSASRKIGLFAAGVASQRFLAALQDQQEIMADLADIITQVYALYSAVVRARKLADVGRPSADVAAAMAGLLADETISFAEQTARRVLSACTQGDELRTQLAILRRLARFTPADTVALSRTVAKKCIEMEKYPM
jgi:butyryl-CoA dehydrogenase